MKKSRPYAFINLVCFVIVMGMFIYLIMQWNELPDKIAGHYDGSGQINRWGDKNELWLIPSITLLLTLVLTFFEHFPQVMLKEESNKEKDKAQLTMMMLVMCKLIFVLTMATLVWCSSRLLPIPTAFLPLTMILVVVVIVYYMIKIKIKK